MFTIKRAAALTGVPVDTLRAWERRYHVIVPRRSDAGYRLYDDEALHSINAMRTLVEQGWAPRQAAERVLAERAAAVGDGDGEGNDALRLPGPDSMAALPVDGLLRAAARFDAEGTERLLDQALAQGSFEQVVDDWMMPALALLGDGWGVGDVSVAGEHLVSATVHRRLAAAFDAAGRAVGAPRVVVGLPPGCRHELGILAFATAARRSGVDVAYLGADLPVPSWVDAVDVATASALVIGVPRVEDAEPASATAHAVLEHLPGTTVFVGGAGQDLVGPPARLLGHRIGEGARTLADRLRPGTGSQTA